MYKVYTEQNLANTSIDADDIRIVDLGYFTEKYTAVTIANNYIRDKFFKKDLELKEQKDGSLSVLDRCSYGKRIVVQRLEVWDGLPCKKISDYEPVKSEQDKIFDIRNIELPLKISEIKHPFTTWLKIVEMSNTARAITNQNQKRITNSIAFIGNDIMRDDSLPIGINI